MPLTARNPYTGQVVREILEVKPDELDERLTRAHDAYLSWKKTSYKERATLLLALAGYLRENKEKLARLATEEMGKTIAAGIAEVEKSALCCEYYAREGEQMLAPKPLSPEEQDKKIFFEPIGVVLAVMPWNFPFWQVYRFLAPALMAGNVGVLKHASNVPGCAEAIEESVHAAGFPAGVFQNLAIGSRLVESVVRDPRIAAVTLTGSEKAGASVAAIAGSEIKKTVLELGGSDPFLVCEDADIELAAELAVKTRMQNNAGQSCIAAKRFVVHESVADAFTEAVVRVCATYTVGDPTKSETLVGPLSSEQGLRDIERQVQTSVELGAKLVFGGTRIGEEGYVYVPAVLTGVKKGMPVYDEETFGPVIPVIVCRNDDEMIAIANDTPYGLSATVMTKSREHAEALASHIESGSVFVNKQVVSDPRAPFGGIKRSGYGRELSEYGIKEFVNVKYISY